MKMIILAQNPSQAYVCYECSRRMFHLNTTNEDDIKDHVSLIKCINTECKFKDKIVRIKPQRIEVEV